MSNETSGSGFREPVDRLHDEGPTPALQIVVIVLVLAASLFVDIGLASWRCGASPPVFWTGVAIGVALQLIAVGIPYLVATRFPTEPLPFHVRGIGIAVLCLIGSMPVMQYSMAFGDGIGHERGYKSSGEQCHVKIFP